MINLTVYMNKCEYGNVRREENIFMIIVKGAKTVWLCDIWRPCTLLKWIDVSRDWNNQLQKFWVNYHSIAEWRRFSVDREDSVAWLSLTPALADAMLSTRTMTHERNSSVAFTPFRNNIFSSILVDQLCSSRCFQLLALFEEQKKWRCFRVMLSCGVVLSALVKKA